MMTLGGCEHRDLRGYVEKSKDGATYLSVDDNNGGHCGSIYLDGKQWQHPLKAVALISPGKHVITCGGDIGFDISPGTIYHFDYWGP